MADWLVEEGIAEDRAILVDNGHVIAARISWATGLEAGLVEEATLIARNSGASRGRARFANGEEALVSRLPRDAAEGAPILLEVTRPSVGEGTRVKPAQARPSKASPCPAPRLSDLPGAQLVRRFPDDPWEDLWAQAWDGLIPFAGGSLIISPTPAMTLVDVDGTLPLRELALAAVQPLAEALTALDLGGSIGIDFPTLEAKADRKALDAALAEALIGFNHERTAINGFGFVQIVARMQRTSLLHRLHFHRTGAAARMLLRRAERVSDAGPILLLTAHPAILTALQPDWLAELTRRAGRQVRTQAAPHLALEGGFAQALTA